MRLVVLSKGRKANVGDVRTHGGRQMRKVAAGKWVPVKHGRKAVAQKTLSSSKSALAKRKRKKSPAPVRNREYYWEKAKAGPAKSRIFKNFTNSKDNLEPDMMGHYSARADVMQAHDKLNKYWDDPRKRALIEFVLPVEEGTWDIHRSMTMSQVNLVAHTLRYLDRQKPLELLDFEERYGGMVRSRLNKLLTYASYMEQPEEYKRIHSQGYKFLGIPAKEAEDRAEAVALSYRDRFHDTYMKVWGRSNKPLKKSRGKKVPIGTKSTHGGVPVVKTVDGWKPVKKNRTYSLADEAQMRYIRQRFGRRPPGNGGPVSIKSEQELDIVLKNTNVAFISAGINPNDPKDKALGPNAVAVRQQQLKDDLKSLGYRYTKSVGKYQGMREGSIIVMTHDADRGEMVDLGKKYNQDAVLFTDHGHNEMLITTGDKAGEVDAEGDGYELVPGAKDFYTEIVVRGHKLRFTMLLEFGKSVVRLFVRVFGCPSR